MAEAKRHEEAVKARTDKTLAEELARTRQAGASADRPGRPARSMRESAREVASSGGEGGAMGFARDTVVGAAGVLGAAATGTVGAARDVIDETLGAAVDVGEHAVNSVQILAVDVLRGAANVGGEAAGVIGGALRGAAGAGAEAAQAAGGALRGAASLGAEAASDVMAAGRGAGMAAGCAVRDLAVGAIGVVDVVGQSAVRTATGLMVGVISGLKEALGAALPGETRRGTPVGAAARTDKSAEKTL